MNPLYKAFRLVVLSGLVVAVAAAAASLSMVAADQQQQQQEAAIGANVTEEMHLITKSLEDLLGELQAIKREATGRLSSVKNRASTASDQERIRQTKVSRFVLSRVAALELESLGMRDELAKLFKLEQKQQQQQQPSTANKPTMYVAAAAAGQLRQEDHDFDELAPATTTSTQSTTTTGGASGMPASTTTLKPDQEEAAKIGFDVEALKKLGEEIGKRLDQLGKEAAKNLGDLIEGAELEAELEARQEQNPETLRGVHEQVIKLVDNMVQNYLSNVRRTVQRMTNLIGSNNSQQRAYNSINGQPRASLAGGAVDSHQFAAARQSILNQADLLNKRMHEFTVQWVDIVGRQQSPLIDRIPPRGVELWRDFWDTVRKQVRRINQEFWQLSQDMSRMITGRIPATTAAPVTGDNPPLYSAADVASQEEQLAKELQGFYDKMSVTLGEEQQKLDSWFKIARGESSAIAVGSARPNDYNNNLIDEQDDEMTKNELNRNVALRQQIQQEINVFGSIFDIMHTFIQRLRESANNVVRDVLRPGSTSNNNNDPVTPGPSVKPQVDKLLEEIIDSQRNMNGQAKPVLLPNSRPALNP